MQKLQATLSLVRPRTLIASLSPVGLAAAWALKNHAFKAPLFLLLLSTALCLQILSNVANDYFDGLKGTDSKDRIGPKRLTFQGPQEAKFVKHALFTIFLITLILGLTVSFIGGAVIAAVFAISIICAIIYTAGPFSLSYHGKAEPFAFLFFGPIPTFFACHMFIGSFHISAFLLGMLPGFYSLVLLTINNLRDFELDRKNNKQTLIVKYGRAFGQELIKWTLVGIVFTTLSLSCFQPKILFSLILIPEMVLYFHKIKNAKTAQDFAILFPDSGRIFWTSTILWLCFYMI